MRPDFVFTKGMYTFHSWVCLSRTERRLSLSTLAWVDQQERQHNIGTSQYWHQRLALSTDVFGSALM